LDTPEGDVVVSFHARRIGMDITLGCSVVCFDTTGKDDGQYLMFQRRNLHGDPDDPEAFEFTGEDGNPFQLDEGIYLERDGQGWSARGGVLTCRLERQSLYLLVSEKTGGLLGGETEFDIKFKVGRAKFARLHHLLGKVFRGEACFQDATAEPDTPPEPGGG
jgi:hypothetical protein